MTQVVAIDEIVTNRSLGPWDEPIDELANDLRQNGLKEPILLRNNMLLIDGLRRVEAVRLLGGTHLEAHVSDDVMTMAGHLRRVTGDQMPPPHRLYEFHKVILGMVKDHHHRVKQAGRWLVKDRLEKDVIPRYGQLTAQIFNLPYPSYIERVYRLYEAAESGDPKGIELLENFRKGDMSLAVASDSLLKELKFQGDVVTPAAQRALLETGVRNITGIIRGFDKLSSPLRVTADEIQNLLDRLETARRDLAYFSKRLSHEMMNKKGKK